MNRKKWTGIGKKLLAWIRNILLLGFVLSLLLVILLKYIPIYYPACLLTYKIEQCFHSKKPAAKHQWVSLPNLSTELKRGVIAAEDPFYLIHDGFTQISQEENIFRAMRNQYYADKGTISQQTARAVFCFSENNYFVNELITDYFTLLIEFVWGKERIMEVYLNSVEMAEGFYGAEATSRHYFSKPASELTTSEAALISVAINNPQEMDISEPSYYMLKLQTRTISKMESMPLLDF